MKKLLIGIVMSLLSVNVHADPYSAYTALMSGHYAIALHGFEVAAANGDAKAMYNLGLMYQQGLGVKADKKKALALFHQSFSNGCSQAAIAIGLIYISNGKTKENLEKSLVWFKRALDAGQLRYGAVNAGSVYRLQHKYEQAYKYYLIAARAGSVFAQYQVGLSYFKGRGVKKDIQQAYNWLYRAKMAGSNDAAAAFAQLLATLTPAQIQKLHAASAS